MGETEIADDLTGNAVLQHITGGESNAVVQQRIGEDEVVKVLIATIE